MTSPRETARPSLALLGTAHGVWSAVVLAGAIYVLMQAGVQSYPAGDNELAGRGLIFTLVAAAFALASAIVHWQYARALRGRGAVPAGGMLPLLAGQLAVLAVTVASYGRGSRSTLLLAGQDQTVATLFAVAGLSLALLAPTAWLGRGRHMKRTQQPSWWMIHAATAVILVIVVVIVERWPLAVD